jgi:hypothetical protein
MFPSSGEVGVKWAARLSGPGAVALAIVTLSRATVSAQVPSPSASSPTVPACRPSAEDVRAVVTKLLAAKVDANALIQELDRSTGVDTGKFVLSGSISLVHSDDFSLSIAPPYGQYRMLVIEATRKRQNVASVGFVRDVQISVSALTIRAPDIIKLIVERNGRGIPATTSTLRLVGQTTVLGAKTVVHEGVVRYPCGAFAPGAEVKVTAISESSGNFVRTLTQSELEWISGIRRTASMAKTAADFIGLSAGEVTAFLGQPTELEGTTLVYKKNGALWFNLEQANGRIIGARPADTSIDRFRQP